MKISYYSYEMLIYYYYPLYTKKRHYAGSMRDMSENARFGESGEFIINENSPNVRKYSNEVANGPHAK